MEVDEQERKKISDLDLQDLDLDLISDLPWAQDMWDHVYKVLKKSFLNWCKIVITIGDKDNLINEWVPIYIEQYENTCCDLVSDMYSLQEKVLAKMEELLKKLQLLCFNLHLEMPVVGKEQLSLFEEQAQLKKKIEEYEALMEVRKKELDDLTAKQSKLCKSLGQKPKIIKTSPLPNASEIEDLRKHIENLEDEHFKREEKFLSLKSEIISIINELQTKPSSSFENYVIYSEECFVTDENIRQLDYWHKSLVQQLKSTKEEIERLRQRIEELWNMLEIDMIEREEFRQKHVGCSANTLQALRLEVRRCEDLKKANIKVFVDKLRKELEIIWESCHCSQFECDAFNQFFYSDCYTEDLLELHEVEISKWKNYYEKNKELLSLLDKHTTMWQKAITLDENATGPGRYHNRGGQLLKEEKERNRLNKLIPQIENDIEILAAKYEEVHGEEFRTFGHSVSQYIANLHAERENNRKLKLSARKQQRDHTTLTPAKSALSLFPSTSTTHLRATPTPMKRKIAATPKALTEQKKQRVVVAPRSAQPTSKINKVPKVPTIKITHAVTANKQKRLSSDRKKRIEKIRRVSRQLKAKRRLDKENNPDDTVSSAYMEFQSEMSSRDDCRSTILPSAVPLPLTPIIPSTSRLRTARNTPYKLTASPRSPNNNNGTKLSACKTPYKLLF